MSKNGEISRKGLIFKKEGMAKFHLYEVDEDSIPSKSMNVFYNEKMKINRDISSLAIMAYQKKYDQDLIIVDSMAASGIGSIRLLLECENIKKAYINDINPVAVELIKKNILLNKLDENKDITISISRKDANFLFSEIVQKNHVDSADDFKRPSVISIDPFGTPNLFINSAFNSIQKTNGLMCITATDTAVLFGIRPETCIRKYMSKPIYNEYCKEVGARILLHLISRMANINKLGIIPLLTFYSNHFIRVFALTFKGQKPIAKSFKNYGYIIHCRRCDYRVTADINRILKSDELCPNCKTDSKIDHAGPLWIGHLHEESFVKNILEFNEKQDFSRKKRITKVLNHVIDEIGMPPSYYNIHKWSKILNLSYVPRMDEIIEMIQKKGYKASRTHFDFTSIKTNMELELLKDFLKKIKKVNKNDGKKS